MPDLQVLIKILTQEVGQEKADQVLKRVKEEAGQMGKGLDDAGEKTKAFSGHTRELKKLAQELSREFPLAGLALKAFANPIGAALTVAVGMFVAVKRHIDELNSSLDAMEANARQPLSNFAEALRGIQRAAGEQELGKVFDNFSKSVEAIKTQADAAVASIHALEAAQKELFSAQEAEQLAKVNLAEAQGRINPVQAIQQRQAIRDAAARQQKQLADDARAAEIDIRQKEAAQTQRKITEVGGTVVSSKQEDRLRALAATRAQDAERFGKLAAEGRFDERGIEVTGEKGGKTLDQQEADLSTRIDVLARKRTELQAISQLPGGAAIRAGQNLKALDEERDRLIAERDAVQTRKAGFKETAENARKLAEEYDLQAKHSETARKEVEKLTAQLEALEAQIRALKESADLSRAKGGETQTTRRRTRAAESEAEQIKAEEAARKKAEAESRRRGKEENRSEFRSGESSALQPEFNALGDAFEAGRQSILAEVKAGLETLTLRIADANAKNKDSLLS